MYTWSFPEKAALQAALPHGFHKHDKLGRPVYIRRIGMVDFDAFFAAATSERIIMNIIYQMEMFKYHVFPAMSRIFNTHIESNCQIFDLTNGSVRKLASRQCM